VNDPITNQDDRERAGDRLETTLTKRATSLDLLFEAFDCRHTFLIRSNIIPEVTHTVIGMIDKNAKGIESVRRSINTAKVLLEKINTLTPVDCAEHVVNLKKLIEIINGNFSVLQSGLIKGETTIFERYSDIITPQDAYYR